MKSFWTGGLRRSMQRVVKRVGYRKKTLAAVHYLPMNIQLQFSRQRHQANENLRYAAANGGRIDHLDASPLQRLRQCTQLLDFTCAKQLGIVIQRNTPEGQGFAHAFLLSRSISRSNFARALSKVFV